MDRVPLAEPVGQLAPLDLAVWAVPTAVLAFVVHGTRLFLLDRRLARARAAEPRARAAE